MQSRVRLAAVLAAAAAVSFGGGYLYRNQEPMRANLVTADYCRAAWDGSGTCMVGNEGYGFSSKIQWVDPGGVHVGSDPECLPPLTEARDVQVGVGVVWVGGIGTGQVFQIDCAGHPVLTPGTP